MDLKSIFSFKKLPEQTSATFQQAPATSVNADDLRHGETYENWGTRICASTGGSSFVLTPFLQKVYQHIRHEQETNQSLQNQLLNKIKTEINLKNGEIEDIRNKIKDCNDKISSNQEKIADLKEDKNEIKAKKEEVNKDQRLKMIIGMLILVPLTLYLFLFYSSTFQSAFFPNDSITSVTSAMFNPQALSIAYDAGAFELLFVLCAPVIFLGLGFSLHFFSEQKGLGKWFKMGSILLVTLLFDCILAYKIGAMLHDVAVIIGSAPIGEEYTISLAIADINTWAVIFCGFIVYIIWGIVFDMTITAYHNLDLCKTRINMIDSKIVDLENQILSEKASISSFQTESTKLKSQINNLELDLQRKSYYDIGAIKLEMTNFFTGWMKTLVGILHEPNEKQQGAKETFNNTIKSLFNE